MLLEQHGLRVPSRAHTHRTNAVEMIPRNAPLSRRRKMILHYVGHKIYEIHILNIDKQIQSTDYLDVIVSITYEYKLARVANKTCQYCSHLIFQK